MRIEHASAVLSHDTAMQYLCTCAVRESVYCREVAKSYFAIYVVICICMLQVAFTLCHMSGCIAKIWDPKNSNGQFSRWRYGWGPEFLNRIYAFSTK